MRSESLFLFIEIKCSSSDPKVFERMKLICYDIGHFYQVQNDFLDCFDENVMKKPGTDIQDGKCTWLAVKCMELCSEHDQQHVMEKCYGKNGKVIFH